jgi:phytoene desaturase
MKKMNIGIIGAGISGLATAARLATRGHKVTVFERNSFAGGKLSEFEVEGYRFDFGPSLFTMPMYVDELFENANENPRDYFNYQRMDVVCNYFWDDKTRINAFADIEKFATEIEQKLGVPKQNIHKSLAKAALKYELTGKTFLENSLHQIKTRCSKDVLKALFFLHKLDIFKSMNDVNERDLKHPKLVQFFNRYATYNGSNPYKASGIMSIIPHFEHEIGAFLPEGGMYDISKSIFELAKRNGVEFHFNQNVEEILTHNNQIKGLIANGKTFDFDIVISNVDIFYTYRNLLPKAASPERILNQPKSTSALIFYWGIKHSFPELDLHNIFFSNDYKNEFDTLEQGKVGNDPTVYINITSKYIKGEAPEGGENWFVMINVPHNSGQDWDEIIARTRKNTLHKVSHNLGIDIESLIETETILDPRTIDSKTASHLGALYGNSSNTQMAAFLRHPNFSSKIKNLYCCGGSVHPGGGIPLCLLSAKIVDQLISENEML